MPNPKKRKTTSAKNQRRSHHALTATSVTKCEKCGGTKKPHYACPACGFYKGNDTKKKAAAKAVVTKTAAKKAKAIKAKKTVKETKKEEKKNS